MAGGRSALPHPPDDLIPRVGRRGHAPAGALASLRLAAFRREDRLGFPGSSTPARKPSPGHFMFAPMLYWGPRRNVHRKLRHAHAERRLLFPAARRAGLQRGAFALSQNLRWLIGVLARDRQPVVPDVWSVDGTPVERARSEDRPPL